MDKATKIIIIALLFFIGYCLLFQFELLESIFNGIKEIIGSFADPVKNLIGNF